MQAINSIEECNAAAQAIGNSDITASVTTTASPRPEGCYDKDGKLFLATNPINQGNGADSDCDSRCRHPICRTGLLQILSTLHFYLNLSPNTPCFPHLISANIDSI